jgi:hypothetical protein
LWYGEPNAIGNAIGYAKFYSRSHPVVIRVFDEAGNVVCWVDRGRDREIGDARRPKLLFDGFGWKQQIQPNWLNR